MVSGTLPGAAATLKLLAPSSVDNQAAVTLVAETTTAVRQAEVTAQQRMMGHRRSRCARGCRRCAGICRTPELRLDTALVPPASKLVKLKTLLACPPPDEDVAFLADSMSLPASERHPLPNLSPQRKKERTLEALIRQLEGVAHDKLVMMVFEDAHWIDPTSRELLDLTLGHVRRVALLLIATASARQGSRPNRTRRRPPDAQATGRSARASNRHFPAIHVISRQPIGNLKKLRRGAQRLPQLPRPGVNLAGFECGQPFDCHQHNTHKAAKFELLSLPSGCLAAVPTGPAPFAIAWLLRASPTGRRKHGWPCSNGLRIF
jgi:hypothetical protein